MKHVNIGWIIVIFLLILLKWTLSVHYVPERTEVTFVNDQYVYNASSCVTRFGRRSAYYFNLVLSLKHVWGNNITMRLAFFENHNNQYKSTFVEYHLKLCDMLEHDPYFGKLLQVILKRFNVSCPIQPGIYHLVNITLPSEGLPNIMPFRNGKAEITFTQLMTKDVLLTFYIIFSVKN